MKKPIIIANWKMNPESSLEAKKLALGVAKGVKGVKADVVLLPPYVFIQGVKRPGIQVGAQNCFWRNKGAYTGEISPSTLRKMGCTYVLLGHSERKSKRTPWRRSSKNISSSTFGCWILRGKEPQAQNIWSKALRQSSIRLTQL